MKSRIRIIWLLLGFAWVVILTACGAGGGGSDPDSTGNYLTFSILYDGTPSQSNVMNLDCSTMGISTITVKISTINDNVNSTYDLGCNQTVKVPNTLKPTTFYGLRVDGKDSNGSVLYSSYLVIYSSWAIGFGKTGGDLGSIILTYVGPEMAKNVTDNAATLSSRFTNPGGVTTTVWFESGTNNAYDITTVPQSFAAAGRFTMTADISNLSSQTTYQYRLAMETSSGITYGPVISFTTLAAPEAVGNRTDAELAALSRTGSSATTRAYDSTYVYYIEDGVIKKAPIGGGTVTTLTAPLNNPSSLVVESNAIYFCERGGLQSDGGIKKIGLNGGDITVLVSGSHWPCTFALDSTNIYFSTNSNGELKKVGINGGAVTTLANGKNIISGLAVDSENIFFLDGGTIKKVSLNGGVVTTLVTGHAYVGSGQTFVDSAYVYFADNSSDIYTGSNFVPYGGIKKISKNGGAVTTLFSSNGWPSSIDGFDTDYVYFRFGTLYRVPK